MSAADIAKVSAWLKKDLPTFQSPRATTPSALPVALRPREKAFQTQIHNYSLNGQTHYANATQISIPTALAGIVSGVRGLNDFRLKPRLQFPQKQIA